MTNQLSQVSDTKVICETNQPVGLEEETTETNYMVLSLSVTQIMRPTRGKNLRGNLF